MDSAPLVIAHRGASAAAPENTLPAFERAIALGAEGIELDAKRTRDGVVIAFHDPTLRRTTGMEGRPGEYDWPVLQRAEAGAWMSTEFGGVRIPSLDEIFETVGSRALINVELSDYWADQRWLAEGVVASVVHHGLERRVLLSSFQSSALRAAHRLAPEIPRGRLFGPTWLSYRDRWPQRRAPIDAEHPHDSRITSPRIADAHRKGRRLHAYTVNDPDRMRELWAWGIDGIITDLPEVGVRTREGR
jgi:glycerophosphoryl diester phosphodiesterase